MANFQNTFQGNVGTVVQGETVTINNATFGGVNVSAAEIESQIAGLRKLLAEAPGADEAVKAPVEAVLQEAQATPPTTPEAKSSLLDKLKTAASLVTAATGLATQAPHLITAIQAVVGAVTAFVI